MPACKDYKKKHSYAMLAALPRWFQPDNRIVDGDVGSLAGALANQMGHAAQTAVVPSNRVTLECKHLVLAYRT